MIDFDSQEASFRDFFKIEDSLISRTKEIFSQLDSLQIY